MSLSPGPSQTHQQSQPCSRDFSGATCGDARPILEGRCREAATTWQVKFIRGAQHFTEWSHAPECEPKLSDEMVVVLLARPSSLPQ